jgi:hypothetical protein
MVCDLDSLASFTKIHWDPDSELVNGARYRDIRAIIRVWVQRWIGRVVSVRFGVAVITPCPVRRMLERNLSVRSDAEHGRASDPTSPREETEEDKQIREKRATAQHANQ